MSSSKNTVVSRATAYARQKLGYADTDPYKGVEIMALATHFDDELGEDAQVACLLFELLEKGKATWEELFEEFGHDATYIARMVATDQDSDDYKEDPQAYHTFKLKTIGTDAILIYFCNRLARMTDDNPPPSDEYVAETLRLLKIYQGMSCAKSLVLAIRSTAVEHFEGQRTQAGGLDECALALAKSIKEELDQIACDVKDLQHELRELEEFAMLNKALATRLARCRYECKAQASSVIFPVGMDVEGFASLLQQVSEGIGEGFPDGTDVIDRVKTALDTIQVNLGKRERVLAESSPGVNDE